MELGRIFNLVVVGWLAGWLVGWLGRMAGWDGWAGWTGWLAGRASCVQKVN